ncbi:MAG: hypothetical protein AB7G44_10030 [Bacteroidia bacterium]
MEWMWRIRALLFILLTSTIGAFAQDSAAVIAETDTITEVKKSEPDVELKKFDEKRWESLTKDLDYNEAVKKKEKEKDPLAMPKFNFNPMVVKVVVVTLVIIALVFLLWKIFGNAKFLKNKKIKGGEFSFLDEAEENLEESDLERFLREALEKKQYKIAVRIYYLMSIKELMQQNFIVWKKNKTNFEYLTEMRERKEFEHFRSLTRAFEIVWYGDVEIEEKEFIVLSPSFSSFINSIRSNGQK